MLNRKWQVLLVAKLFEESHDVASLRNLLGDLRPEDVLPIREQIKARRLQATLHGDNDIVRYCDLIIRVVDSVAVKASQPISSIQIGKICMVPVNWTDESTTDAAENENMRKWKEAGEFTDAMVNGATESGAVSLHFFDPTALKRRTAHVTTESFIRLMQGVGDER